MSSILIVQASALDPRAGAAQIALHLRRALVELGHSVDLHTPEASGSWWQREATMRAALAGHLRVRADYDLVDAPSWMIPSTARRSVARSVQPDLDYLEFERSRERGAGVPLIRRWAHRWHSATVARAVRRGWRRADRILCLGAREAQRMSAEHPALRPKLRTYRVAPGPEERRGLREVLAIRRAPVPIDEARFLWIGRWSAHKGLDALREFALGFLGSNPNARLTIAGTGTDEARWRGFDARATARVRVVPTFERSELPALLAEHDAGLFTSSVEGWGLGLQEMLESGLPVFAVRAGAFEDLAPWFPGQLRDFPPSSESALAGPEPEARFSSYARAFDWQEIAREYLSSAFDATRGSEP